MSPWSMSAMRRLRGKRNPSELLNIAVSLIQALDMEYLSLTLRIPGLAGQPKRFDYNNYPAAWNEQYRRLEYDKIDPVYTHCLHSIQPLLWHDGLYNETPALREHACSHGLRHGWTLWVNDHHSQTQLSVARATKEVGPAEFYEGCTRTLWLCNLMHPLLLEHHRPEVMPVVTEREMEVLKWCAAGKTASEIATILQLSSSTVNFHIRSIISKTNASNKTGAIAVAAKHGLLDT